MRDNSKRKRVRRGGKFLHGNIHNSRILEGGIMADIRLVLGRLRPSSEYHWKGGPFDDYSQIGEWRDLLTAKPTLAEIETEWNVYLTEKAAADAFDTEKMQAEASS